MDSNQGTVSRGEPPVGAIEATGSTGLWTNRPFTDILSCMAPVQTQRKARISPAKIVIPLVTLGILFILWRYHIKWPTVPIIAFLIAFYFILPKLVRRRLDKFNRKAILLLTGGKAAEVRKLVTRSIFLQLFGPSGPLEAKLGLAYAQCGEHEQAVGCFENAIPGASPSERPALQAGLVKSLFVIGDLARAEAEGYSVLRLTRLPETLAIVARARVGLGKNDDETRRLLDEAETLNPSPDIALMIALTRIESALESGRKPGDIPQSADSGQPFVRAWIHLVRGRLREHRGDTEKSRKSFMKAFDLMPRGFVGNEAEKHIERFLPKGEKSDDAPSAGRDPAIKRKRRKRR